MIPTRNRSQALEIAPPLFRDSLGYSPLPMNEERQMLRALQHAVRGTSKFARAQRNNRLISQPARDGMALLFFGDLTAPVRCALELSRSVGKASPWISLRMGLHSGPGYRIAYIHSNRKVAGAGIEFARRVMDCSTSAEVSEGH
jgi:hypothetical protein